MVKWLVMVGLLAALMIPMVQASTIITGCQALNTDGMEYILVKGMVKNNNSVCFPITADNITLNGNGSFVSDEGGGTTYYSITVRDRFNVTIKNLTMNMSVSPEVGRIFIDLDDARNTKLENINITGNYINLYIRNGSINTLVNNSNLSLINNSIVPIPLIYLSYTGLSEPR